jgi:hypothetical protein
MYLRVDLEDIRISDWSDVVMPETRCPSVEGLVLVFPGRARSGYNIRVFNDSYNTTLTTPTNTRMLSNVLVESRRSALGIPEIICTQYDSHLSIAIPSRDL